MFNIYYINYEKAYQIAMLIDNKFIETKQKEKTGSTDISGNIDSSLGNLDRIPFVGKYMPKLDLEGEIAGTKSHKVIDTVKVISTKSTILQTIYSKTKEVKKFEKGTIGSLIRIKNISLSVINEEEVLGIKTMVSGAIGKISVEGLGDIDIAAILSVLLKDAAYILEGTLPESKFGNNQKVALKIPMLAGNELENQYSLSDLEIGKVSLIGIYRGAFKEKELLGKLNRFSEDRAKQTNLKDQNIIERDSDYVAIGNDGHITEEDETCHYLDVIAVVQEISF